MPQDALDPGPNGDYPHWPRNPDGTPDEERMPTGVRRSRKRRRPGDLEPEVVYDVTPRDRDGNPIIPPTLPPS